MSTNRNRERGFSLIMTAVCTVVMLGMLGLSIDLSRMYIMKNELQVYVDAAVMAAALELDGTTTGIERARNIALYGPGAAAGSWGSNPNRYNFGTQLIPTTRIDVGFSQTGTGGWESSPASAAGYTFVRAKATTELPVYLLRIFEGVANVYDVPASAIAGQLSTSLGKAGDPFSPDAVNPADPNYGYTKGAWYTLRWAPKGKRCEYPTSSTETTTTGTGSTDPCPVVTDAVNPPADWSLDDGRCPGEIAAGYETPSAEDRGYIDLGQGSGNAALTGAIIGHEYGNELPPVNVGDPITILPGQMHVGRAMADRFAQDSDTTSATYAEYVASRTGNGRRLIRVPVNDSSTERIIGYATFFMPLGGGCSGVNSGLCCAEYVSNQVLVGGMAPGSVSTATGVIGVKLMNGGY